MAEVPRVGLVVHYSDANYGNHLVNLAAKRLLERCGCDVDVLTFVGGDKELRRARWGRLPAKIARLAAGGQLGARMRGRIRRRADGSQRSEGQGDSLRQARREKFVRFAATTLQPAFVEVSERFALGSKYDFFVIGSDQIWNYDYRLGPWLFLDFVPPDRRICLAPSIGHTDIPAEWKPFYRTWAGGFRELSVRESHWQCQLERLVPGVRVTPLIDPTLALEPEEWIELARPPVGRRPYLLVYELGDLSSKWDYVQAVAAENDLDVVRLSEGALTEAWATDPADFLGLIHSATCVVTDSFHGAVFAFLMDSPLVIVRREGFAASMNGRVDTLVERLCLGDRVYPRVAAANALSHDYSAGRELLVTHQAELWAYLARQGLPVITEQEEVR